MNFNNFKKLFIPETSKICKLQKISKFVKSEIFEKLLIPKISRIWKWQKFKKFVNSDNF